MPRHLLAWTFAAALVVLAGLGATPADAQKLKHPRLHAALHELYEARMEARKAKDDFHGHRDQALIAMDDAIFSLQTILKVRGDNVVGLDRNPDFYKRHKDHPRLRQALDDLRDAREELQSAKADVGNLKERALNDIDVAIKQIRLAIKEN